MEQVKFTYKDHNQTSSSKVNGAFTFQKFFFFFFFQSICDCQGGNKMT